MNSPADRVQYLLSVSIESYCSRHEVKNFILKSVDTEVVI